MYYTEHGNSAIPFRHIGLLCTMSHERNDKKKDTKIITSIEQMIECWWLMRMLFDSYRAKTTLYHTKRTLVVRHTIYHSYFHWIFSLICSRKHGAVWRWHFPYAVKEYANTNTHTHIIHSRSSSFSSFSIRFSTVFFLLSWHLVGRSFTLTSHTPWYMYSV